MKDEILELRANRALKKGKVVLRSCWECNPAHEHLKKSDYIIACFSCGKIWYKGNELHKLKKDGQDKEEGKSC